MEKNKIDGNIPAAIGKCKRLKILDLTANGGTGEIPTALGDCSDLTKLFLQENNLTGEIPASLGKCTKLEELYLDNNQLSGGETERVKDIICKMSNNRSLNFYNSDPKGVGRLRGADQIQSPKKS